MRFLLDVHIAKTIGSALASQGHDVARASDGAADWTDERLLRLAVAEGRILITEDSDFSDLIFRYGVPPPPSVLYLRYEPDDQPGMADRILLILANTDLTGHMVVVQPSTFRLRPFPARDSNNG